MFEWLLTFANGVLVFVVLPALVLAFVLWSNPATRRDMIEKARILRGLVDEAANEFGPILKTTTGRNAALLALTGALGVFIPDDWAAFGANALIFALLVYYMLRTFEGRKRAAGPIVTALDANAFAGGLTSPGVEMERALAHRGSADGIRPAGVFLGLGGIDGQAQEVRTDQRAAERGKLSKRPKPPARRVKATKSRQTARTKKPAAAKRKR